MGRAILIILDSLGIGGAPDANFYNDEGANTFGSIAMACANGDATVSYTHLTLPTIYSV